MELSVTFGLIAKLASADGAVSSSEVKLVEKLIDEVLKLDPNQKTQAIEAFNIAKKSSATFAEYAEKYKKLMADKPEMLSWMLDILVKLAFADKIFSDREIDLLDQASKIFGISLNKYEKYFSKISYDKELALLGCASTDSIELITEKYNALCEQYSPEKIIKLGLPNEFVKLAESKTNEFNEAFNALKKQSGK